MHRRLVFSVVLMLSLTLITTGTNATVVSTQVATHFRVSAAPTPIVVNSGQPFNVTVTALDASNTVVTDYAGTVHFSSSNAAAALPADYTFVAGDNGMRSFSVTPAVSGGLSITATDTGNASIRGTAFTYVVISCPPGVAPRITPMHRICALSSGNRATVYGVLGKSLLWTVTNGTITGGQGTSSITFTAGVSGFVSFRVAVSEPEPCYPSRVDGHAEIFAGAPVIESQSHRVQIRRGQTAVLSVSTSTSGVAYQWFEGNTGDTSAPIANSTPTFTTPALQRNTHYWVRLITSCGSADSAPILVQVTSSKSRSARR